MFTVAFASVMHMFCFSLSFAKYVLMSPLFFFIYLFYFILEKGKIKYFFVKNKQLEQLCF